MSDPGDEQVADRDEPASKTSNRTKLIGVLAVAGLLILAIGLQQIGIFDSPQKSTTPVQMVIEEAGVEAPVEQQQIIDGVMQDPSGAWVVSWYRETDELGEEGNAVFAGHLDFDEVRKAVFYNLGDLRDDDLIVVNGKNGSTFTYQVDWVENVEMAEVTQEQINFIVFGGENEELITLITCGGPFDYASGEYLERTIVRGHRVTNL